MGDRASKGRTKVQRVLVRELIVTRTFNAPARIVFEAWTNPELFMRWWAPKSCGVPMLACEIDVRTGGGYRLVLGHDWSDSMEFFGKYIEVSPPLASSGPTTKAAKTAPSPR